MPHLPTTRFGWILLSAVTFLVAVFASAGLSVLMHPRPYDPMKDGVKSPTEVVRIVESSFQSSSGKDIGIQADIGCETLNNKRFLRGTGFAYNSMYTSTVIGDLTKGDGYSYSYSGQTDKDGFMYFEIDCTLPAGWYVYRLDNHDNRAWMQFQFRVYPLKQ
jgi:hypothetical protein